MSATVATIHRYPVKGLSPEPLDRVILSPGAALPGDRRFALARAGVGIDTDSPPHLPKRNFLMLALNARLAALRTRFDTTEGVLRVERDGKTVARGKLDDPMGRSVIENFFFAYLGSEAGGTPRLVEGPAAHTFSDVDARVISIINLASVDDLKRSAGSPVDPLRFRGNIAITGAAPWEEFTWVGRDIRVGDARLRVDRRIDRCAATTVNPDTGERDLNVVRALQAGYGHIHMGVYATVLDGAEIALGDAVGPEA